MISNCYYYYFNYLKHILKYLNCLENVVKSRKRSVSTLRFLLCKKKPKDALTKLNMAINDSLIVWNYRLYLSVTYFKFMVTPLVGSNLRFAFWVVAFCMSIRYLFYYSTFCTESFLMIMLFVLYELIMLHILWYDLCWCIIFIDFWSIWIEIVYEYEMRHVNIVFFYFYWSIIYICI